VLELTERRVIQANVQISAMHSDAADEARKQATDYLTSQLYQVCEERRRLLEDVDAGR
jgi:hypothetical protein